MDEEFEVWDTKLFQHFAERLALSEGFVAKTMQVIHANLVKLGVIPEVFSAVEKTAFNHAMSQWMATHAQPEDPKRFGPYIFELQANAWLDAKETLARAEPASLLDAELAHIKKPQIRAMVKEYIEVVVVGAIFLENQESVARRWGFTVATLTKHLPPKYRKDNRRR